MGYTPYYTQPVPDQLAQLRQGQTPAQAQPPDSGIITLRGITNQCRARYRVSADANIAVAAGGTAGAISVSLALSGEPLNSATAIVTPAAVGDLFNVHAEAIIDVPRGCCLTIALENTSTQAITAQNVNVIVDRVA